MSDTPNLDAVRDALFAIPAQEVEGPRVRALKLQAEMRVLCRDVENRPELSARLARSGFDQAQVNSVRQAALALGEAETQWMSASNLVKSTSLEAVVREARRKRSRLIDACQLHLGDRKFSRILNISVIGDDIEELGMHLKMLATLVQENAQAFANNQLFAVPQEVAEARDLATRLADEQDNFRVSAEAKMAKDLRDRAATYAWDKYSALRASGRFVTMDDPALRALFNDTTRTSRGSDDEVEDQAG